MAIPTALGLGAPLQRLPYRFLRVRDDIKLPKVDFSKYLNSKAQHNRTPPSLAKKFALLEYVVEYWPWHSRWLPQTPAGSFEERFWDLLCDKILSFEFRPWGPNKHFGPYGCRGCPPNETGFKDLRPMDLPLMGLIHWAAANGYLRLLTGITLPQRALPIYLMHERYSNEMLLMACRHGQSDVLSYLIKVANLTHLIDERLFNAACASGSVDTLEVLLRKSSPEDEMFDDEKGLGHSLLYQAAADGHLEIVRLLLQKGGLPWFCDERSGMTPLGIAAQRGHVQIVKSMVPNWAQRDRSPLFDRQGMTPLHYAAAKGHFDIVSHLLHYGWEVNLQKIHQLQSPRPTALVEASKNGHPAICRLLLDNGADPSIRGGDRILMPGEDNASHNSYVYPYDPDGFEPSAIHYAARQGHDKVLEILPCTNIDSVCGRQKASALHYAVACGHIAAVRVLLSKGARVEREDRYQKIALHYAAAVGCQGMVQILIDGGSSIDWRDTDGFTALHDAALHGHNEVIRTLVAHGMPANAKTSERGYEITALHPAAEHANTETVKLLVEAGSSMEEQDMHGRTALQLAISQGRSANVLALIKLGAHWQSAQVFGGTQSSTTFQGEKMFRLLMDKLVGLSGQASTDQLVKAISAPGVLQHRSSRQLFDIWIKREPKFKHPLPDEVWLDETIYFWDYKTKVGTFKFPDGRDFRGRYV